jgi:hypothetical protein
MGDNQQRRRRDAGGKIAIAAIVARRLRLWDDADRRPDATSSGARMNIYHAWCNLRPGVRDIDFCDRVAGYLDHLKAEGMIAYWRLTRRKLGLAPPGLGEFHIMIEVTDLAQLDAAFDRAAARQEPTEGLHFGVNSLVQDTIFALYRDFPDPVRHRGEEKF